MQKSIIFLALFFLVFNAVASAVKGRATWHHPTNNPRGACGHVYNPGWNGGNWVAMNAQQWTAFGKDDWGGDGKYNRNRICGKTIMIRSAHNQNAVQRKVRVIDQCPECGVNNLDISQKLYKQLNKGSLESPDGRIDVIWRWD